MAVKKILKDGKPWWVADYRGTDGKRHRKSFPTRTAAEALVGKARDLKYKAKVEGNLVFQELSFSGLVPHFLAWSKTNSRKNTYKSHQTSLVALEEYFGEMLLHQINLRDVELFKAMRRKTVSAASVNRELSCIRLMLNLAIRWKIRATPAAEIIKMLEEPPGRVRYLSQDEAQDLLENCGPDHLRVIVLIALNTGLRRQEILDLTWDDIDLENNLIHVSKSKGSTRGQQARRDIPINSALKPELVKWKRNNPRSKLFPYNEIKTSWKSALKRAGIKGVRFHDLRHTFASWLVMEGVDLTTVCRLMGHSTIEITMKYAHLSPDHRRRAVELLGQFFVNGNLGNDPENGTTESVEPTQLN